MPNSYDPTRDLSSTQVRGADQPGVDLVRVTPSDAADLAVYPKSLRIFVPLGQSEGALRVTPALAKDDANVVTLRFPAGVTYEPLAVRKIWATGTSADLEIHAYTL